MMPIIGGSVVGYRGVNPLQDLIDGLQADGVFTILDRLWVFAQMTEGEGLVDLVVGAMATAVNSPTFTANRGYTSDDLTSYLDSNFDISTGTNYVQDSACGFIWSNTESNVANDFMLGDSGTVNFHGIYIDPRDAGDFYGGINDLSGGAFTFLNSVTSSLGLFAVNRTGASASEMYHNGSQLTTSSHASIAIASRTLWFLRTRSDLSLYSQRQISAGGCGGSLTSTEHANLYNRLRTYMTAVGVP